MQRRITIPFITLSLLLGARASSAQDTLLWQQTLRGTGNGDDFVASVAVDNLGNVLAAGSMTNIAAHTDFTVTKFDRNGTLLWQQTLTGTANISDAAISVVVDNHGNVLAAGYVENSGTGSQFTVAKFDRDGTLLWQQALNRGTAYSVMVDHEGNVIAVGEMRNTTGPDFTVVKFDGDGTLLWQQTLNGPANGADTALSVTVDHQGNVIAAGVMTNTTELDFAVATFDRDGTLLWQQTLNGTANGVDVAKSVAVDNHGSVLAAGLIRNTGAGPEDFTVAKFDRDGTLLWQQMLNGTAANSLDEAYSVTVDHQGNVLAAGFISNSSIGAEFTVVKFDGDGTLLWQQALNRGVVYSVKADHQGNVLAAGGTTNPGTGVADFTVAKFDRDGTLLWQETHGGAASGNNLAYSVAVDQQGNVIAAGEMTNIATGRDFTVMKFTR